MKHWRSSDLLIPPLAGKRVAIVGYGSQGRAQAMNLRDSGVNVVVGLRSSSQHREEARREGFEVCEPQKAVASSEVISLLIPESAHEEVLSDIVFPHAPYGTAVVFAHGFTPLYTTIRFRNDIQRLLVAPKAIGPELRRLYEVGKGAPALISAEPGDLELAKAYAFALGCGRAIVLQSTFREETEADLFSEQAVLCGGLPALIQAAFDTLVESGYSEETAYFECLFEVRLIAEIMLQHGIAGMMERISDTARFGASIAAPLLVDDDMRNKLAHLLRSIQNGEFARAFQKERAAGMEQSNRLLRVMKQSRMEMVHRRLQKETASPTAAATPTESTAGETATRET